MKITAAATGILLATGALTLGACSSPTSPVGDVDSSSDVPSVTASPMDSVPSDAGESNSSSSELGSSAGGSSSGSSAAGSSSSGAGSSDSGTRGDSSSSGTSGSSSSPGQSGSSATRDSEAEAMDDASEAMDEPSAMAEPEAVNNGGPAISLVNARCSGTKMISQWHVSDPQGVKSVVVYRYNEYNAKIPYNAQWMGPETGDGNHWANTSNGGQNYKEVATAIATDKEGKSSSVNIEVPGNC